MKTWKTVCLLAAILAGPSIFAEATILFENVLYLAGTTGATTKRTPADRASDIVNIKDFGALGDNSHDDTANIQAAIDWNSLTTTASATTAAGGTTVTLTSVSGLSAGCCTLVNVTRPSSIPEGVHINGIAGNVLTLGSAIIGVGVVSGDTIKVYNYKLGKIFFPPGTYKITAPITFSANGELSVILSGVYGKSFLTGSVAGYVLDRNPAYNPAGGGILIENLDITNTNTGLASGCIRLGSTIGATVRNVKFDCLIGLQTSNAGQINAQAIGQVSTVQAGGSGYAVGDTISLNGGTFSTRGVLTVTAVSSGAVTAFVATTKGEYTVKPSNPVAQSSTSGGGSSATFNIQWAGASQSYIIDGLTSSAGSSTYIGSKGIIVGANGSIRGVDISGVENGIVAYGVGPNIYGFRLETNGTGISLGVDEMGVGPNSGCAGFSIIGGSFESNGTAIDFPSGCGDGFVSGIKLNAFSGAAPGGTDPQYGIRVRSDNVTGTTFSSIEMGSSFAVAAMLVGPSSSRTYNSYIDVRATNTFGGASVVWSMPSTCHSAWFFNSNNPLASCTFANLPSGSNVTEGDQYIISDGATGNCADSACNWGTNVTAGGGALHRLVRWNASNWTVMGK